VPITTKVASSNSAQGEVYLIQHYVIKFVKWFFLGTPFSSTNKTDCHDITEKLLKALLNTTALTQPSHITGRIAKMSTMDNRLEAMAIQ
jgi:hypothetical protein